MERSRAGEPEVVVVTGASAGVGRAVTRLFAERGARVALLARGEDGLAGAARDVEERGGVALPLPTDVSDARQVESAAARVERELGPITTWVNCAMVTVLSPLMRMTAEEFARVTDVTYHGYVHGTMAALRRMLPRDHGSIVQVGSALAYRGIPLQSAYCGAKHAIQGFTESVRCELLHDGSKVRISMVQMPALNTPQFGWCRTKLARHPQPVPPIYQPEVAARAVLHAADHDRREMAVGGNTVVLLWGNKFFPGLGDHYLARTGYDSQQTDGPVPPDRPDNLFSPLPGDRGAHGAFDDRAHPRSRQLWANTHLPLLAGLGAAAAALGVLGAVALGRRR